jgi:hypothetical protein
MKLDRALRRRVDAPVRGDWEFSIRRSSFTPLGVFLTTPRRRIWLFLRHEQQQA